MCIRDRDEGRRHDRHAAVLFIFDGTRRHDARHAAARGDQHRDEALAGESETTENTVHDKRDARHVAAVLQDGQEEEQDKHCLLYTSRCV